MKSKLGISVLFVEDEKTLQLLYKKVLGEFVETLYVAGNGLEAFEIYKKEKPDLVIADINIPGINGIDLIYKIREISKEVKIIIITAHADSTHLISAIEQGTNGFLLKPFTGDRLKATVLDISNQIILRKNIEEEIKLRRKAEHDLLKVNSGLEKLVKAKTRKLEKLNKNLEKQVQEELEKRQKQQQFLIHKSRLESMGELAAGMAHEINQPLLSISMGLDNILHKVNTNKFSKDFLDSKMHTLFKDIERIKQIIEHVRAFSRDEAKPVFDKVSVEEIVHGAISMVQKQYSNHGVEIEVYPDENRECETQYVLGSKYRFEQVILNLLSNAKRAIEKRFRKLPKSSSESKVIRIYCTTKDDKWHVITVKDNGIGIPKENLEKIFDPFFTTSELHDGTGLGLSIVYGILKEYNGKIEVESKLNQGTEISIFLPKYNDYEK